MAKQVDPDKLPFLNQRLEDVTTATLAQLWDEMQGFFVSGPNRQISWAGQTRDGAVKHLKSYWGGMLRDGADTFWELYDPHNKAFSPYGSYLINSYCHAWSCTPTYLIRKYTL
ncbi:hypothetical protein [Paenibacillus sp. RC21]|uniref:hypothetical protein n=1 Tax=Paenibacillus sp. RC21 TaxID=3156312 RepID=UPI0038368E37